MCYQLQDVLGRTEAAEIELAKVKANLREHQDLHTAAATATATATKATQKKSPLSWKAQDAAAAAVVAVAAVQTLTISPRASAGEVRSCRTLCGTVLLLQHSSFVTCLKA
jgi:hypothetical protein